MKKIAFLLMLAASLVMAAPAQPVKVTKYYYFNYISAKEFKYMVSKLLPGIPVEVSEEFKSVIINDTVENVNIFENFLKQIDVKTRQIQISSKIVETKLAADEKYGVNWTWQDLFNKSGAQVQAVINDFMSTDNKFAGQIGTLKTDGFNAVFNYLLAQTNTDLLSSPQIVTLDGKEANISTGEQLPIRTTTNSGGVILISTVFKDTGVKLRVTPQIKDKDYILLDIHPEVSDVLQYDAITGDPIISIRKVDGSVIVKDNETLMVGGLLQNKALIIENKIPVLGDIPLLGVLFKSTSTEKEKTEIIIFITPHIIKEGEKLIAPEER
jgi:general secretion pathway protein D